jgi:phosphohistidine phosphatase
MLTLLLMRHAKSGWDDPSLADHERPLNARGRKAAPRMAELLVEQKLVPELIITSTARRALDTAHAVVTGTGYDGRVEVTRRLYLAEPGTYLEVLGEIEQRFGRVLVVGHNPGISELVGRLTGESVEMPTAAIARIELALPSFAAVDARTRGKLLEVFKPKELD